MKDWRLLVGAWDRLRWARLRAGFERAKDAADSLGIKPGTYRTYEYDPTQNGREPPLTELQRICRKFKVSWVWVASGQGDPDAGVVQDERLQAVSDKFGQVDPEKQDDAMNAVLGVLDAFRKRA